MLKVTAAQYWFESHILIVSKETVLYIGGQVCNYHEGLGNSLKPYLIPGLGGWVGWGGARKTSVTAWPMEWAILFKEQCSCNS